MPWFQILKCEITCFSLPRVVGLQLQQGCGLLVRQNKQLTQSWKNRLINKLNARKLTGNCFDINGLRDFFFFFHVLNVDDFMLQSVNCKYLQALDCWTKQLALGSCVVFFTIF